MKRRTVAADRLGALLAAIILIGAGLSLLAWWSARMNWIPNSLGVLPERLSTAGVTDAISTPWWPWVGGAVGVLLALLGLRWLAGHVPDRGVRQLNLPGSADTGRLVADAGTVADAAALVLEAAPGVRSVRGTMHRERGQVVARLTATIEREADLALIARAADQVSADLAAVLERDDLHCRVQLNVAARHRSLPRVR